MEFLDLLAEEAAVRRHVEELCLPFHRDLAAAVDAHELADDVDLVEAELAFRMDRLETDSVEVVVALDPATDGEADRGVADADGELAGFVETDVDEAPHAFERPDRLVVCDLYVHEPYRGGGLARELMVRAAKRAREEECGELRLDVDVDNERALGFYEKLGFEPLRHELVLDADDLA